MKTTITTTKQPVETTTNGILIDMGEWLLTKCNTLADTIDEIAARNSADELQGQNISEGIALWMTLMGEHGSYSQKLFDRFPHYRPEFESVTTSHIGDGDDTHQDGQTNYTYSLGQLEPEQAQPYAADDGDYSSNDGEGNYYNWDYEQAPSVEVEEAEESYPAYLANFQKSANKKGGRD